MSFSDIIADAVKGIPLAEVLRERLAYADQQYSVQERELAKANTRISDLEAENLRLKSYLQEAEEKIRAFEVSTQKSQPKRRSDEENKLLLMLTEGRKRTTRDMAREIGHGVDRTESILNDLAEKEVGYVYEDSPTCGAHGWPLSAAAMASRSAMLP